MLKSFSTLRFRKECVNDCLCVQGMDRTARNKFDGGDAAWEEEKMKSYRNSEVRLVEIQEKLCTDLEKGEDQVSYISDYLLQLCLILPCSNTTQ